MSQPVQPIFILPEGTKRSQGKNAQRNNIMAAKAVAETVRTTLGPKGMDKMLVDKLGDIIVTNDGVTILREMQIEHPTAKMIVEVAKTQEDEVGDGTTTAVILAGELLRKAEDLLDQDIHPTVLAKGYRLAEAEAQKVLLSMAEDVKEGDLLKVAITAMTGKGAESAKEHLAQLVVDAVVQVAGEDKSIDLDDISVEKKVGASVDNSVLVQGIILDKERCHSGMPRKVAKARIALIDSSLEIKNTEVDAKIQITSPEQMQHFLDMEEKMLRDMVDAVEKAGATVLICQKGIDDVAQHFLAKRSIYAVRRAKKSDLEAIAKATGARIVTNLDDLSTDDLGHAGMVEERKVGDEDMTFIEDCKHAKAVTLLVRGGTEHVVEEVKRAVDDSLGDVAAAFRSGKIVAGAGAVEIELAKHLRGYAQSLSGREQLAVNAFADAIEVVPRTLAENAGLDPIDTMTELKSAHGKQKWAGIDVFTGKVMDAWKAGILEPLKIKTQAISSATEVSVMILRIDDIIAAGPLKDEPRMPDMPGM
ncbi:thermosome subunit [Candidatus Woesearchaeota archaeon CG1_02_57_44]|nr:MAG: thermosome subunit [Candidatus Woesearchaeota archaeon CG1_02_57_44]